MVAVILALGTGFASSRLPAQATIPQYGRKPPADKGPRALGLVQLSPTGKKARIIPIAIMMDGKFYDAGSYKAAPVPMALDFGIVYEGFRTGVSQGVFTITQPGQLNHEWIAEGTWLPAGAIDPAKPRKYSPPKIADDDNGPPVLHRRAEKDSESTSGSAKDQDKDKDKNKNVDSSKDKKDEPKPATAPPSPSPSAAAPDMHTASTPTETAKPPATPEPAKAAVPAPASASDASRSVSDEPITDPNRPRLRRGKPDTSERHEPFTTFDSPDSIPGASPAALSNTRKADAGAKDSAATHFVLVPAISDSGGPDPRPYTYELKPAEEASYRSKMLDLAAAQLRLHSTASIKEAASKMQKASSGKSSGKAAAKPAQPAFDDVSLRIFDLSSSNEPVLVLSAKTHPAAVNAGATGNVEEPKEITLIARSNLENELQKLFFSQTDSRHLDVSPRMELIDAVDADGDSRGELLFRRTFDNGSAYAIYRVSRDGLWTLFEGTP